MSKDTVSPANTVGDFYWAYADILRGAYGVSETLYDQRVMAFMALKLLVDNNKVGFNFDHSQNFGQSVYVGGTKAVFLQLVQNLPAFDRSGYMAQTKRLNNTGQSDEAESCLALLNSPKVFDLTSYVEELSEQHLKMVLDIYQSKADFRGYPREGYKDLYERTVWRMANSGKKSISGQLTGQHFTQRAIIQMMCAASLPALKGRKKLAIYDPTCGVGSMLMESCFYFKTAIPNIEVEVYGQELAPQVWILAKIFLEVAGIKNTIALGNTLTAPAFSRGINGDDSFDFIIANPPFGVDWKHSYADIVADMGNPAESSFFTVTDADGRLVTPRKSDGQLLFIQQIMKLMQREVGRGKCAHAAVVTSGTLISVGTDRSADSRIRNAIFESGLLGAVLEQPGSMFTNTEVTTHVWFFSAAPGQKHRTTVKAIKADSALAPMFSAHPEARDKMRNTYSAADIKALAAEVCKPGATVGLSKLIPCAGRTSLNIGRELASPKGAVQQGKTLADLDAELKALVRALAVSTGVLA